MGPLEIVKLKTIVQTLPQLRTCCRGIQIDIFIFNCSPESLNKDVVQGPAVQAPSAQVRMYYVACLAPDLDSGFNNEHLLLSSRRGCLMNRPPARPLLAVLDRHPQLLQLIAQLIGHLKFPLLPQRRT